MRHFRELVWLVQSPVTNGQEGLLSTPAFVIAASEAKGGMNVEAWKEVNGK